MEFTVLLDAPTDARSRLQIARLGEFDGGSRYGDFTITRDDVESWRRNLEYLPGQRALIDLDHRADRSPRNTEAAGWITDIGWDGETPVADVEWTPVGEKAIKEKRYLFFSPTYGPHKTEDGAEHDNTLIGGALTNRPFLTGMPAITLASEENLRAALEDRPAAMLLENAEETMRVLDALTTKQRNNLSTSEFAIPEDRAYPIHDLSHARNALARASGKPEEGRVKAAVYKRYPQLKPANQGKQMDADSRPPMDTETVTPNPDLVKLLDLGDDADDAKILEAIAALKDKASKPSKKERIKTLEQEAAEKGLVVLDQKSVERLQLDAAAGATAMKQLHEQRFDTVFDKAVSERKVTPAERDDLHATYLLDSDLALRLLENRQPIMSAKPQGNPTIELDLSELSDPADVAAAGFHPGSHDIARRIDKYMLDNKIGRSDYVKVLEDFQAGRIAL